jgi:hypothetical protein
MRRLQPWRPSSSPVSFLSVGQAEEGSALPVSMQRSISAHVKLIIAMERIEKAYGRAAISS